MSLSNTSNGERIHIGFFGVRNAGKSSLVNAITNQELSVVSEKKGTTTDPVIKSMELLPLGPVLIIDTPGIDDEGTLGELRVKKAKEVLAKTDIAVLVVDAKKGLSDYDNELLELFKLRKLPYLLAFNKSDLIRIPKASSDDRIYVSARDNYNIEQLKKKLADYHDKSLNQKQLLADLVSPNDIVLLVMPIDNAAPKARLILPQQQTIRALLDAHCSIMCCQETDLKQSLEALKEKPKLVITDSQAFKKVAEALPNDILLTSFSILFARYKGDLKELIKGAATLSSLKDNDNILISEACTHHRQCNDIGTVKLPNWIQEFTGKKLNFSFSSGATFPENLSDYKLVVHCGACMINEKEMQHRIATCQMPNVPIVNYGIAIAHMNGILERSLEIMPNMLKELH